MIITLVSGCLFAAGCGAPSAPSNAGTPTNSRPATNEANDSQNPAASLVAAERITITLFVKGMGDRLKLY
jgi:hypothetical protein